MDEGELNDMRDAIRDLNAQLADARATQSISKTNDSLRPSKFRGDGTQSPQLFLSKLHDWLTANNLPHGRWAAQIPVFLDGACYAWFSTLPNGDQQDYDRWQAAFMHKYDSADYQWLRRIAFDKLSQGALPLKAYVTKFQEASAHVNMGDHEKKTRFILGLTKDVRDIVVRRAPETFEQAVQMANLEAALSSDEFSSPALGPAQPNQAVTESLNKAVADIKTETAVLKALATTVQSAPLLNHAAVNTVPPTLSPVIQPQSMINPSPLETQQPILTAIAGLSQQVNAMANNPPNRGNSRNNKGKGPSRNRNPRTEQGEPICVGCNRIGHFIANCQNVPPPNHSYQPPPTGYPTQQPPQGPSNNLPYQQQQQNPQIATSPPQTQTRQPLGNASNYQNAQPAPPTYHNPPQMQQQMPPQPPPSYQNIYTGYPNYQPQFAHPYAQSQPPYGAYYQGPPQQYRNNNNRSRPAIYCEYCNKRGHSYAVCRSRLRDEGYDPNNGSPSANDRPSNQPHNQGQYVRNVKNQASN